MSRFILILGVVLVLPAILLLLGGTLGYQALRTRLESGRLESGMKSFLSRLEGETGMLEYRVGILAGTGWSGASASSTGPSEPDPLAGFLGMLDASVLRVDADFRVLHAWGTQGFRSADVSGLIVRVPAHGTGAIVFADPRGLGIMSATPLPGDGGYLVLGRLLDTPALESMTGMVPAAITLLDAQTLRPVWSSDADRSDSLASSPGGMDSAEGRRISGSGNGWHFVRAPLAPASGNGLMVELAVQDSGAGLADPPVSLVIALLAMLALVVLAGFLVTRSVIRPVADLHWAVESMRRHLAEGSPLVQIPVRSDDEIGDLARAINGLAGELHDSGQKLSAQQGLVTAYASRLEERVKERTAELEEARLRAEMANRHKSRFLVDMNHELRTPLNTITGLTDLLRFGAMEKHAEIARILGELGTSLARRGYESAARELSAIADGLVRDENHALALLAGIGERLGRENLLDDTARSFLARASEVASAEAAGLFRTYSTIKEAGDSLLSLIDEIINLSRVESGVISIDTAPVDVAELVQSCMTHAWTWARSRGKFDGLKLESRLDPGVPGVILADGQKVKQVILNLLVNGVKYTDAGTVSLVVDTVQCGDRSCLRITVSDTGRGIPEKDQDMLFLEFGRAFDVREIEGAGLGLALSRRLVECHGGTMDFTSREGAGSRFWFTIPLLVPEGLGGPGGTEVV